MKMFGKLSSCTCIVALVALASAPVEAQPRLRAVPVDTQSASPTPDVIDTGAFTEDAVNDEIIVEVAPTGAAQNICFNVYADDQGAGAFQSIGNQAYYPKTLTPVGAASGSITYEENSVVLDGQRLDAFFINGAGTESETPINDSGGDFGAIFIAPSNNAQPVPCANAECSTFGSYIFDFCLDISADACGDHTLDFVTGGANDTALLNDASPPGLIATELWRLRISIAQPNDDCVDAVPASDGLNPVDTTCATTDGPDSSTNCSYPFGDALAHNDIWYEYTATCTGDLTVETCDLLTSADEDSRLVIYPGTAADCPFADGDEVTCDDDGCTGGAPFDSTLTIPVNSGENYVIRVGQFGSGADPTDPIFGEMNITCQPSCTDSLDPFDPGDQAQLQTECSITPPDCQLVDCDPGAGGCIIINDNAGVSCDDSDVCTNDDQCDGAGACVGGPLTDCTDSDTCTIDFCDQNNSLAGPDGCVNDDITADGDGAGGDDVGFCDEDSDCAGLTPSAGGCDLVNNICECGACFFDGDCDDGNVCTVDTCVGGNIQTGQEGTCANEDVDCDDGVACTTDSCDGSNQVSPVCVNDPTADCMPTITLDLDNSACIPAGSPIAVDVVLGDLGANTPDVCGAQLFLSYDNTALDFVDFTTGANPFNFRLLDFVDEAAGEISYAAGPDLGEACTPAADGAVIVTLNFLATGLCEQDAGAVCFRDNNPGSLLSAQNGQAIYAQGFDPQTGDIVDVSPYCTPEFNIDDGAPVIDMAPDLCGDVLKVNADCGGVTAAVDYDISVSDGCGGVQFNCVGTYFSACENNDDCGAGQLCVGGVCDTATEVIDPFPLDGHTFQPGQTDIVCDATDKCGGTDQCSFTVVNSALNTVVVDVEMSPTMHPGSAANPLVRAVDFLLSDCGDVVNPQTVTTCAEVQLGAPDFNAGHGRTELKVEPGNWACIEAQDQLHTLASTCSVDCRDAASIEGYEGIGDVWYASFKGTPNPDGTPTDCHWLVGGNLTGTDIHIDIGDFVVWSNEANDGTPQVNKNTTCSDTADHADVNGDGIVNILDFSFIAVNFLDNSKDTCEAACDFGNAVAGETPVSSEPQLSISVRELAQQGLGLAARRADVNNDGVVDVTDMALVMQQGDMAPQLSLDNGNEDDEAGFQAGME